MSPSLIINADDFGYSVRRNMGIIQCIKEKRVTSTSVLVNGTCLSEVLLLQELQAKMGTFSICLHFNITEGIPISDINTIPSLVNSTGHFLGKFETPYALSNGNIDPKHIETELKAQINKFKFIFNQNPIKIDGHNHIHVFPQVREVFVNVLILHNIKFTRIPYEEIPNDSKIGIENFAFYKDIVQHSQLARVCFDKNNLKYPSSFVGLFCMGTLMVIENLDVSFSKAISKLVEENGLKVIEFMAHPGLEGEIGTGGCGLGPDEFELSHDREFECKFLCGNDMEQFLKSNCISLKCYEDM